MQPEKVPTSVRLAMERQRIVQNMVNSFSQTITLEFEKVETNFLLATFMQWPGVRPFHCQTKVAFRLPSQAHESLLSRLGDSVIGRETTALIAVVHVVAHEGVQLLLVIWRVDIEPLVRDRSRLPKCLLFGPHC